MSDKLAKERIEVSLKEEFTFDRVLAAQNEKIRESIGNYKFWLAIELRKAHQEVFRLQKERDLLIKQNLEMRNQLSRIKDAVKGDIQ